LKNPPEEHQDDQEKYSYEQIQEFIKNRPELVVKNDLASPYVMNTETYASICGDEFMKQEMAKLGYTTQLESFEQLQAVVPDPDVVVIERTSTRRHGGRPSRTDKKRKTTDKPMIGKKDRSKKKVKTDRGHVLNPSVKVNKDKEEVKTVAGRQQIMLYSKNINFSSDSVHSSIERERECQVIDRIITKLERLEAFRILFGK
jgi:hypothetical protein